MNTVLSDAVPARAAQKSAKAEPEFQKAGNVEHNNGSSCKKTKTQIQGGMISDTAQVTVVSNERFSKKRTESVTSNEEKDEDETEEDDHEHDGGSSRGGPRTSLTMTEGLLGLSYSAPDTLRLPPKRRKRDEQEVLSLTFPQRLMEVLDNDKYRDIISWLPHGRGFVIYHKKRFAAEIMPTYFKKSKFTSFTRKLNRWNFTRITRGPETGAYYHDYFKRNKLRLCMQMSCQHAPGDEAEEPTAAKPKNASTSLTSLAGPRGGHASSIMAKMGGGKSLRDGVSHISNHGSPSFGSSPGDLAVLSALQNQVPATFQNSIPQTICGIGVSGGSSLLEDQRAEILLQQQLLQQQHQQLATMGGLNHNLPRQDMGLGGAFQQRNTNMTAYVAMIMAQEKAQAQRLAALGQHSKPAFSPLDFALRQEREQLMQAQHQQQQLKNLLQQEQRIRQQHHLAFRRPAGEKPEDALMMSVLSNNNKGVVARAEVAPRRAGSSDENNRASVKRASAA